MAETRNNTTASTLPRFLQMSSQKQSPCKMSIKTANFKWPQVEGITSTLTKIHRLVVFHTVLIQAYCFCEFQSLLSELHNNAHKQSCV